VPIFEISYSSGSVTGTTYRNRPANGRPVDNSVPMEILDQRMDWAVVMSADLMPGKEFEFRVCNPGTGISARCLHQSDRSSAFEFRLAPSTSIGSYTGSKNPRRVETYQVLAAPELPSFHGSRRLPERCDQ
jgi:hypothetical protein